MARTCSGCLRTSNRGGDTIKLYFVTGNAGKLAEVRKLFEPLGIEIDEMGINYPELQADSLEEVVEFGLKWLHEKLDNPGMCGLKLRPASLHFSSHTAKRVHSRVGFELLLVSPYELVPDVSTRSAPHYVMSSALLSRRPLCLPG